MLSGKGGVIVGVYPEASQNIRTKQRPRVVGEVVYGRNGERYPKKPPSLTALPCVLCSEGSNLTPAHHFQDFRFKTYAPVAFRYFRELFGIRPDDYLVSVSQLPQAAA